ncbi:GNAT family N-acetyltransferase [Roseovarius salis]|uniref:GNAT family N-acetyltransferase n=1 Tax=Roseovarius salis TaxID=3376063 RepID=UPI0037CBEBDD
MTEIRQARLDDADGISAVLIASIRELCLPDHNNDPAAIGAWIANKTPDQVRIWLEGAHGIRVATQDGEIASVGAISHDGRILLLYAAPRHAGRGHCKALLHSMEEELAALGHDEGRLVSTKAAHPFFLARGWQNEGPAVEFFRTRGQPMRKRLARG